MTEACDTGSMAPGVTKPLVVEMGVDVMLATGIALEVTDNGGRWLVGKGQQEKWPLLLMLQA